MLGEAVRQCVEAAGHEYDPNIQKSLLRVRPHLSHGVLYHFSMFDSHILFSRLRRLGSVF